MSKGNDSMDQSRELSCLQSDEPRFSFVMIVLNGMPFIEYSLKSIYDFAHQIIIVEGAVEKCVFAANHDGSSNDGTVEFIKSFPDPKKKIRLVQGKWPEKCEMQNEALKYVTGNYVWLIDSDEVYKKEELEKIRQILKNDPSITQVNFIPDNFWRGLDYVFVSKKFFEPAHHYRRLFKYVPGAKFTSDRPPTMLWTGYGKTTEQMNLLDGATTRKLGIIFYHYSYVLDKQVRQKDDYYLNLDKREDRWGTDPSRWYKECFLKWTPWGREDIESKYPVWLGDRNSHTLLFGSTHPEIMMEYARKYQWDGQAYPAIPVMQNLVDAIAEIKRIFPNEQLLAVETGTIRTYHGTGQSTYCISNALGERGRLISVDNSCDAIRTSKSFCYDATNIKHIESDSAAYLRSLGGQKFHFAFLDSANDKDVIFEEFRLVVELMVQNGIIMIDDAGITRDGSRKDTTVPAQKGHRVWEFLKCCGIEFAVIPLPNGAGTQLKIVLNAENRQKAKQGFLTGKQGLKRECDAEKTPICKCAASGDEAEISPKIHFVYSGRPDNDAAIKTPLTITNKLFRFLQKHAMVRYYDFADTQTPAEVGAYDIVLGHPHPSPGTMIRRLFEKQCAGKFLIWPLHTRIPEINRYVKDVADRADKLFIISGPYWMETIGRTEYAGWKDKIVRLDNAIDGKTFRLSKHSFNSAGNRGLFVLGRSGPEKGTAELFKLLCKVSYNVVVAGNYSAEDLAIIKDRPNTRILGPINWADRQTSGWILRTCDFFVNMSISDASPTTLLETMALGLIPITTPQCGYYYPSFLLLSLGDEEHNILLLQSTQTMDEQQMLAFQLENRRIIEEKHSWEQFCNSVWSHIQPYVQNEIQESVSIHSPIEQVKRQNQTKRVLIVRPDSIGDNVLAASMLPHIRKKFEHARITVLCQEHIAELYEDCPFVDNVVVFNRKRAYEDAEYTSEIINLLRALKPDVSLNSVFSSEPITHVFATECGASERIAIEGDLCNISAELRQKYNQSYTKLLPSAGEHKPELARHRDFLKGLGVDVPLLEPVVWTSQEDENFAKEFFEKNNLKLENTIALFPTAQNFERVYPFYHQILGSFNEFNFVILGGSDARPLAKEICENLPGKCHDLTGKTSIHQMAGILRRCRLYLGAESAGAHIACAVGIPNIVVLGGGHFGRFVPYSPLTSVVCLPLECYGCDWKCGYQRPYCVKDIASEVIVEAVQQSLEKTSEKPRVFIQAASMWSSAATGPKWKHFDQLLDTSKVEIVNVGGSPATDKKYSPAVGSNVCRTAARLDQEEYPTISIVTPSYNQKDYLEECICSILDQGYPNLEYIIMDGGSTDGSVEIIKKYANHLTYWQSKPDNGQYAAINEGFKRTTGEIMTWLNSDDKFHPNAFKTVVSVFMHRKDIEWLMGRPNTFDEQGQQSWIERHLPLWSRERYLKKDYKFIQQEGTFWRRSLWEKAGATLQVNLDLAGDLELWARFFRFAQLYTVDALTAGYRYHPGQKAQSFMDRYIEEAEKILDHEILLFKEGKYKELLPAPRPILISEIKEFLPFDANEINQKGQELLTKGDFVGALDAFTRAIKIVPNSVIIHNNIGRLYLQKGEPANALKYFTRALKIDSHDYLTVLNCGQLLAANGRIEDARKLYWAYLQRHPEDKKIVNVLARLKKDRTVEVPNDKYLVSAVVSTYNSERFIRGCLEDLESQTIADRIEIIVVDSGSQQNEGRIVEEFQKKYGNIKYIRTEHREGIYAAWNRAVKVAQGRFITNANTDDRYREDALQQMAYELLANPDIALVYADQIQTNTPNDSFAEHHGMEILQRPDYSRQQLLFGCCVGSQPMWRKSLHNEFGYFDETLTCAGDWDFWLRISQKYGFKHIPECLGLYYYNQDGIEHGKKIHSLYERYVVGKRYETPYISVIPIYKSMGNPLVSGIMPAYNAETHIAATIESVLIQNYRNFELIIVNDGSTDRTEEIIKSFKDERIRYFLKENSGPSAARNFGIRHAGGEFIVTFDSDDMVTPDFIARHLQEFQKHPEADLVYCDDCLIDENDKPIRIINRPEYKNRKLLIRDLFRAGFPVVPFRTTCIRKSVFDKIGLFDERLLVAEDYDMVRRFVKNGLNMHHLAEPMYLRRMTPNSLSRKSTAEKAKIHFDVVKRFTDTFTYDELFPDVAWDKIPAGQRQLHARCLAAVTFFAIGQTYVEANSPVCAETAFDQAYSDLKDCLKMDPDNRLFQQLLHKFELLHTEYAPAMQQVAR